jgi:UDP-3-O-[3-hydroxymyristoyl] N-acetylglucosamine deacetylase / 3-hydroxyacyl-[acyl-carrier-protein] dehydratase
MMKQKTIGNSFIIEGIALHTGLNIKLKASPAPVNHGIIIRRIDLDGQPEIEAIADNVGQTVRGTVLKNDNMQVSTIEHAMAAFYAAGIDNCLFEVDGPEFPILDGSARFFRDKIREAGIIIQDATKDYLTITDEIEFKTDSGSVIKAYPADKLEVEVMIGFDSDVLREQTASLDNLKDFNKQTAHARTFVFVREIEPLLKMDLIKGGDLKNAIVIYDKIMSQETIDMLTEQLHQPRVDATQLGYLNGGIKFENEPAMHKLLDLIGDLALVGRPVKGRIVAKYPGHKINTEFAKLLRKTYLSEEK